MKYFELSLKQEIEIYINEKITPTELFIIRLLFIAQEGDSSLLANYISNISNGPALLKDTLISLKTKGIITSVFKIPKVGQELNIKEIPFNKNFIKRFIKESNYLGSELLEKYPAHILINGRMCSIKNFTKANLFSPEEFCNFYAKAIKHSPKTHKIVMEELEYAKENELIRYSILEFIASRKWEEIKVIRESGDINGYNNTELL